MLSHRPMWRSKQGKKYMYQPFQQQAVLPFSCDQFQNQFLNITLNNPPYVPQYQGLPQIQQIAPVVAAAAALEIQQNAQKNQLRVFMFNQYSQNNFANQDFDALVTVTLDYITMELMNHRYPSAEMAMQEAVPFIVGLLCAVNVQIFEALQQYVQPQLTQGIRNDIAQFQQIASAVKNMRMQMNSGMNVQQPYQQPMAGFNARGTMAPVGNGNTGLFSGGQSMNTFGRASDSTVGSTKYGNDTATVDVLRQPFNPRGATVTTNEIPNVIDKPIRKQVLAATSGISWKPLKDVQYLPAYNPTTHELYYVVDGDNNILEITLKERAVPLMDFERHSLSTVFGPVPKGADFSNAKEVFANISEGIRKINNAVEIINADEHDEHSDVPEVTTYIQKEVIAETSLQVAWLYGSLSRLQAPAEIPDVYRCYARIAEPIITNVDENSHVINFASAKTFIELREKIDSSIDEISSELWGACNIKMTKLINRIIKQNLAIPKLSIGSFVSDIQDLIEYLGTKFGQTIQDAFLRHQRDHIAATFQLMYPESAAIMTADFLEERQFVNTPNITYLASVYSLTYLNCTSHELNVELAKETAAAVMESELPIVYSMLKGLFVDVENHTEHSYFDRHLVRTTDGRVIEASRGALNCDVYLLTLVR